MQAATKRTSRASVGRWGNSLALRLTSPLAKAAGLQEGDDIEITASAEGLLIRRARKSTRQEKLLQGILNTTEEALFGDLTPATAGREHLVRKLPSETEY